MRLTSQAQALADNQRSLVLDAAYIGLMAGLLLYNLLLFIRVREALYLYYVGWMTAITLFVLAYAGTAFQYFWPEAVTWNDRAIALSLLLSMVFLMVFWVDAHREHLGDRWPVGPVTWFGLAVLAMLAVTVLPYRIAIQLSIVLSLGGALVLIWFTLHASRQGYQGARGLLRSFLPLLVGGYLLALQRYGLLPHSWLTENAVAAGSALQGILLSAMLADRLVRLRELRAASLEIVRFNQSLADANAALTEALTVSESRASAIAEMKERLRQVAENKNRDKSKFLAQAVHDLKQPLQAISLALSPIQAQLARGDTAQVASLFEVVQHGAQLMRVQITGLLDLSRLESGFVKPKLTEFALRPFIEQLLAPPDHLRPDAGCPR